MVPVKYVLYSHFCPPDDNSKTEIFQKHVNQIEQILADDLNPGLLVLFYDPSWLSLLNTVGRDFDPVEFTAEFSRAREFQTFVNATTIKKPSRIRLTTAADLSPIVNNLRGDRPGREATRLRRFLSGSISGRASASRYDTSKVVEAIVRLRQIGSGIPVFRIDWDALFNSETLKSYLRAAIPRVLENYHECNEEPTYHSFVASAGYLVEEEDKPVMERDVTSWLGAFATRVFPALLATPAILNSTGPVAETDLNEAYDAELVRRFYGLQPDGRDIEVEPTGFGNAPKGGITSFGSHPFKAVISGALFCLSDGAILDLPPFSNFRQNVMWIDDHLKYALHRDLEHLSQEPTWNRRQNRHLTARVPGTHVLKDRPNVGKAGWYTLGNYLPTVLGGTIMDAWIQPKTITNVQHLDPHVRANRGELYPPGVLTRALADALRTGRIEETHTDALTNQLRAAAMMRIKDVAAEWTKLESDKGKSLAALWVTHPCGSTIRAMTKPARDALGVEDDWLGWGLFKDPKAPLDDDNNLNPKAKELLEILIEDAMNYIEWTLEWPRFIQSVRAVRQGTLRFDLRWNG